MAIAESFSDTATFSDICRLRDRPGRGWRRSGRPLRTAGELLVELLEDQEQVGGDITEVEDLALSYVLCITHAREQIRNRPVIISLVMLPVGGRLNVP